LVRNHRLSVEILSKEIDADGMMTVRARAKSPDGQYVDDEGVLDLNGIDIVGGVNKWNKPVTGIGRANGMMKCVTKAKRRAVLGKCGLGTAAEDVTGGRVFAMNMATGELDAGVEDQTAPPIAVDMDPRDRVVMLISMIVDSGGGDRKSVYAAAIKGSRIPVHEYDGGWAAPNQLTDEDAKAVGAWLELNKHMKRSASEAKPRPRPPAPEPPHPAEDDDQPF
jgi:hypothetical protein